MLKSYFKIALRNLRKNKVYSFINVIGLTLGLTSFLLIALYVFDELTADRFHKNTENIYRVIENRMSAEGKESKVAAVAYNITAQAKTNFTDVVNTTRFSMLGRSNIMNNENTSTFYESYYLADESFFKVFDFRILDGDRNTALKEPYTVVLTKEAAKKIYGTTEVVGKTLRTDRDSFPYKITAVLETLPANSHLSFSLLFSEASLTSAGFRDFMMNDWSSNTFVSYIQFKEGSNIQQAGGRINQLVASKQPAERGTKSSFTLQPLKDIHFYSAGIDGNFGGGNIFYIYVFSVLALFVIVIACINYVNLTTARFANRSKEIAVRKVAGAFQKNLVSQFISEAFLVTFIALALAIIAVKFLLPSFNAFLEKNLLFGFKTDYRIWVGVVLITIIVALLSGTYPAFFQSRLKPVVLLRSKSDPGKNSLSIRKMLVVFQFTLSIVMIVSTIVVYLQLKYVSSKNLGFNKDQVLIVDINSGGVRRGAETIKSEFLKLTAVKNVSVSSRVPGEWKVIPKVKVRNQGAGAGGDDMFFIGADEKFTSTFEIPLISGRNFTNSPADSSTVMLNETAALQLGIKAPSEQLIEIPAVNFSGNASILAQPFQARVIGITKDFNFRSLREKVAPMVIAYQQNPIHNIDYFVAKVSASDMSATLEQMKAVLFKIDPEHLFEYNFLDKQWELFYREDQKRQTIFMAIALLTILIACLGLFGLATYSAEQRTKEIGIRKVLGASTGGIVSMLSKDFLKLVLVATMIAIPLSWFAMDRWLQDFAYRVNISWWIFALAAIASLLIAFITVSFQSVKAAISNPVKSLRAE